MIFTRSLSDLGGRYEGKTGLSQILSGFEEYSHSIRRKRTQNLAKSGFSAVDQAKSDRLLGEIWNADISAACWGKPGDRG